MTRISAAVEAFYSLGIVIIKLSVRLSSRQKSFVSYTWGTVSVYHFGGQRGKVVHQAVGGRTANKR